MAKKKDGKKARKAGRNSRRPSTARRKYARPEVYRKARNALKSCGKEFLTGVWTPDRIEFEVKVNRMDHAQAAVLVRKARDRALA